MLQLVATEIFPVLIDRRFRAESYVRKNVFRAYLLSSEMFCIKLYYNYLMKDIKI